MKRKVSPRGLKAGMVLAEPLMDTLGRVLLEKGEVLTELYIRKIAGWQIEDVFVEGGKEAGGGPPSALTEEELAKELSRIDEALGRTFSGLEDDPRMRAIREAARAFLVARVEGARQ